MKKISYGDTVKDTELDIFSLECLESTDNLSANNINRTLQNLHEDIETNYNIFQNILKNVYGGKEGILPNAYEEFQNPRLIIDQGNKFLRIPFGVLNTRQYIESDYGKSYGLAYSGEESEKSAKKIRNKYFINDGYDSYSIVNRPKLSVAKRQMADFINLDLSDLDNDVKLYTKTFNSLDEIGASKINGVVNSVLQEVDANTLSFPVTTYYFEVVENSISSRNTETYFPNKGEQTSWYLYMNTMPGATNLTLSFYSKNGTPASKYLPPVSITRTSIEKTVSDIYNTFKSEVNGNYGDYFEAEIVDDLFKNETKEMLKITSKIGMNDFSDDVVMMFNSSYNITYSTSDPEWYYSGSDIESGATIFQKTNISKAQNYYLDSISVLYGLFSKYSSYAINENVSKKEFALEDLILLDNFSAGNYIVYLNNDLKTYYLNNAGNNITKSLSPSKLFGIMSKNEYTQYEELFTEDIDRTRPLVLYEISYDGENITSTNKYSVLDPSELNTRAAKFNNLVSDTNTLLKNSFVFTDEGRNADNSKKIESRALKIEVSENRDQDKDRLMEIFSPVINVHTFDKTSDITIGDDGVEADIKNGRQLIAKQRNENNDQNKFYLKNDEIFLGRKTFDNDNGISFIDNNIKIHQDNSYLEIHKATYNNEEKDFYNYIELGNNEKTLLRMDDTSVSIKVENTNDFDLEIVDDNATFGTNLVVNKTTTLKDTTKAEQKFYVENKYKLDGEDEEKTSVFTVYKHNINAENYDVSIKGDTSSTNINTERVSITRNSSGKNSFVLDDSKSRLVLGNTRYISLDVADDNYSINNVLSNSAKTELTTSEYNITIPTTNVSGSMAVGTKLTAEQLTSITNQLRVNGDGQIAGTNDGSTLYVGNFGVLNGGLEVEGKTYIDNTLDVNGATTVDGTLNVKGTFTKYIDGEDKTFCVLLNGGLEVAGKITINNDLSLEEAEFNSMEVKGEAVTQTLGVTGETKVGTTLTVKTVLEANSLTLSGNLSGSSLFVAGTTSISGSLTINNSGNVTIGTETGATTSIVENAITTGTITATSVTTTSAKRYKKDIVPTVHTNAIEEIKGIDIVDFFYKEDVNNEMPKVGFIADYTNEVFSTPKHDSMDVTNCIGMLLKAVQELSKEIEELKSKVV